MASPSAAKPIPAPRIVYAATSLQTGLSHLSSTQTTPTPTFHPFGPGGSGFAILHTVESVPAALDKVVQVPDQKIPRPPPSGVQLCTSDMPPGAETPTHRTVTVDYAIVTKGELVLKTEAGECVIREGEIAVLRGAMHSWKNNTTEWARTVAVMIGAEKLTLNDGKVLDGYFPAPPTGAGGPPGGKH